MDEMPTVFRGRLAECLRFGHCFEISGRAKDGAMKFHISLASGYPSSDNTADIALHILVNFHKDMITLKKYLEHDWHDEESKAYDTSQFHKEFKIYIVMADEKFHISINMESLGTYKYGIRLSAVNFLEIAGDLEYVRQVDHRKYFPYSWPPIQVAEERLQFSNDTPMPFKPGHVVVVQAQLMGNENGRFILHLRNVCDIERQELHLSVRFDSKVMVRNSKTTPDGEHYSFDEEELDGDFPFEDFLKPFKLALGFTATNEVKIAKDGLLLCEFVLRTPQALPLIGGLKIFGIDGVYVSVSCVDHIQMADPSCKGFENYSNL